MSWIVCLMADPERHDLAPELVEAVGRALGAAPRWLAPGEACEFAPEDGVRAGLALRAGRIVAGQPVDLAVVPAAERLKRLLVSDMDSTIITVECIDELADLVGLRAEVAAITRRAMDGELDFRAALEARVALLEGLATDVFEQVYRERVRLMPGARTLVRTMRAKGATTALVSGGFLPFVERVRDEVGFDVAQANRLEERHGRLTGRLLPPVHGAASKLKALQDLARERGLTATQTLAVGDGANDLPMVQAAGLGVAYRARPKVAAEAEVAVRHGDLTSLLYLQGIPKRDFVR